MITLQIGPYANHVASHYWNQLNLEQNYLNPTSQAVHSSSSSTPVLPDSYFSNPLWNVPDIHAFSRSDVAKANPRVLIFDAKGSLGSLSSTTAKYVDPAEIKSLIKQTLSLGTISSVESLEV